MKHGKKICFTFAQNYKKTLTFDIMDVKMLRIMALLLLIVPFQSLAQVYDDFSDGDFTENPVWSGTDNMFKVNDALQLQLNASEAGNAMLFCQEEIPPESTENQEFEWHFWLREAFAPSSKNYCDVYLCDKYFVRFGEAGNNDVVDLQRLDGTSSVSVCRGTDTFIASAFSAFFKVIRDAEGTWKIFVDKMGNGDYLLEAQGVDRTYTVEGKFGIKTTFSASNAKKVFLDDVYAGPLILDTEPPVLKDVIVLKYNKLQLEFSESLDDNFVLDADNYVIDNQIGKPMYAEFGVSHSSVILSFANTIEEEISYTLIISKIQDLAGNISEDIRHTFIHYTPHENDVVINEIMADPEPSVGLPSFEYVELYNTKNFQIKLKDWVFVINNSEKIITQDVVIQPVSYLILCKEEAVPYLSEYGYCVGFSSFSITNSGAHIALYDNTQILISSVDFDISWYCDKDKSEGGWSLEQIDPYSPCAGAANWVASREREGGTPGSLNSVDADNPVIPYIDYVDVLSSNSIEVIFNQKMDTFSMEDIENYTILEFDTHPIDAVVSQNNPFSVQLTFSQNFELGAVYNILVFGILTCSGVSVLSGCRYEFGLPDEAVSGDVVINEILFDPVSPAADYVELFNKSDKVLNISHLKIGVVKTTFPNPPDTIIKTVCQENRLLLPEKYLLLTTTPDVISSQYDCSGENFIRMESFPSYPNDGASVVLYYDDKVIDFMSYSSDSHYPLLTVTKGVALERVSPYINSSDSENWHSAAAPLYGTPGYQNSVFMENQEVTGQVEINPSVFSPDGDGFDDVTIINLSAFKKGYTAKIIVFDAQGRLVKNLVNCQNIANQSCFVWNGTDENGKIVPIGIYVVYVELFDIQGDIKIFKKIVVVASK